MDYAFLRDAFHPSERWTLKEDGLEVAYGERPGGLIPFGAIRALRLREAGTRADPLRHECELTTAQGTFLLLNRDYRGVMDFQNQSEAYNAFVKALHGRLANQPGVAFRQGDPGWRYALNVAGMGVATLILVPLMFLLSLPGILLGAFVLFLGFRYMLRNRPKPYDPNNLGSEQLAP